MRHAIPTDELEPAGQAVAAAIESCVHCGFCLPTCPTYVTLGEEMDSPRGRILLAKGVLEGALELEDALPYLDNCLGCQACVTACPSGVPYGELITGFRAHTEPQRTREPLDRTQRLMIQTTLPHPRRFRLAVRLGAVARPLVRRPRSRRAFPKPAAAMLDALPAERLPKPRPLPSLYPAQGPRRARVALLAGCVQQALDPDIGWATLRVLARNGVETVIPPDQGCCGALALHTGQADTARAFARRNLAAFGFGSGAAAPRGDFGGRRGRQSWAPRANPAGGAGDPGFDAVITNAAGCGSGIHDYELLFRGEPEHDDAAHLAETTTDVATFLHELGLSAEPPPLPRATRVAYHDACHLAHAQGVREAPRKLLEAIPGVEVVTPPEWELCCGSAGTYNVEKPEIARRLGARKAGNLRGTDPDLVAAGNIGCITQIHSHAPELSVLHTIQILDRAYSQTL